MDCLLCWYCSNQTPGYIHFSFFQGKLAVLLVVLNTGLVITRETPEKNYYYLQKKLFFVFLDTLSLWMFQYPNV